MMGSVSEGRTSRNGKRDWEALCLHAECGMVAAGAGAVARSRQGREQPTLPSSEAKPSGGISFPDGFAPAYQRQTGFHKTQGDVC